MINFKNIAKQATVISEVMTNRTKVNKTNGIYNIVDFDIVKNDKGEEYAICAINEREFINGGFVLTKIFKDVVDAYGGDKELARKEFVDSKGFSVRLDRQRTKAGRDITTVEVLE